MTTTKVDCLVRPVVHLRNLTSTEARHLRAAGVPCSPRWKVSPSGSGTSGYLFRPAARGGWDNANLFAFPA